MYNIQKKILELKEGTNKNIFIDQIKQDVQMVCKEIEWFKQESRKLEDHCHTIEKNLKEITQENKMLEDEIKFLTEQIGISQRNNELLIKKTNDFSSASISNSQANIQELGVQSKDNSSNVLPPIKTQM